MLNTINNGAVGEDDEFDRLLGPLSGVNNVDDILRFKDESDILISRIDDMLRGVGGIALKGEQPFQNPYLN